MGQKIHSIVLNRQLTTKSFSSGEHKRRYVGRLSLRGQGMLFRTR